MEYSHTFSFSTTTSPHPLPPIPSSDLSPTANLVPRPLFTPRARSKYPQPPLSIAVAVIESPDAWLRSQPSPTFSSSSSGSSTSSTSPIASAFTFDFSGSPTSPGPPPYTAVSPSWSQPPPPYQYHYQFQPSSSLKFHTKGSAPQLLRRKPSPKQLSLRALRAKESDACLQRIYERQTMAYLDGTVFGSAPRRSGLRNRIALGD